MFASGYDSASLFSGGGFMPSQATQLPGSGQSPAKSRAASQGLLPLTVKQISEAYNSSDDKSNFIVDGVETTNVRLLGLVMNKTERVTDISFTLDDGTGRLDITRWVNDASDASEMAEIQNGIYVKVNGHLKGFQGKKHAMAFCVRPVIDFNDISLHFLECIHVHLVNTKQKVQGRESSTFSPNLVTGNLNQSGAKIIQAPLSNQFSAPSCVDGSETDIYKLVLGIFQDPASLAQESGIHVDEVKRRLGIPMEKIRDAIDFLESDGLIYSTIDDNHFKSTCNG